MEKREGFTLIELMVVIFIIGILAAAGIPIVKGRIDSAKWSEGKSGAGSIRTAARSFCGEKGPNWGGVWGNVTLTDIGFTITLGGPDGDLDGKYFTDEAYAVTFNGYDDYLITVTAADSLSAKKPTTPASVTLDEDGAWTENP